ncbi:hypothetical protein [Lysinibacillus fusiformis]|uniref:hypothetical protein n=1 Tax=Lysinibacillus fusiformis TaxID=28031 RepID=UPI0021C0158B|nr:hypothetical protein [Lysinibacillus fusiformis]UXJ67796.1 hypothetical protein N5069_16680 [Lysinibacillus fusiformis]
MILLVNYKVTETKALVQGIHYDPFHPTDGFGKAQEELETEGHIFVERSDLPIPENNGMIPHLYVNPQTKEMWHEYEEMPKSEIEILRDENRDLKIALAESVEAQQQDKIENQIAIAELVETLTNKGVL